MKRSLFIAAIFFASAAFAGCDNTDDSHNAGDNVPAVDGSGTTSGATGTTGTQ